MVERFNLVQYEHFDQLDKDANGEWVRYSDYAAQEDEKKRLTARGNIGNLPIGTLLRDHAAIGDVHFAAA